MWADDWKIDRQVFDLDEDGFGTAIYEIKTGRHTYSFVVFASYLDPAKRSDRVIASEWDMTVALCAGTITEDRLSRLRDNVPLQEGGRLDADCIVLSRANKSVRNFSYVVEQLASGKQPSIDQMARVGYLYRTTAVYGSGKFGMADWQKVCLEWSDFGRPFSAELFVCYLIRQFSLDQADYLARRMAPDTAVPMDDAIKRYVGIGNATGLGMAPYLINHPRLVSRWIEVRETALARVLAVPDVTSDALDDFVRLAKRAVSHLRQISTDNDEQNQINSSAANETELVLEWLKNRDDSLNSWTELSEFVAEQFSVETQELTNTLLIELYPDLVDDLADDLCVTETCELDPAMPVSELRQLIETNYRWALDIDMTTSNASAIFWYRSQEKQEPRLGERNTDIGEDREMSVDVARSVQRCHAELVNADEDQSVADFVWAHPRHRAIVRRIQEMSKLRFGDIHENLLDKDVLPIHLLRCKLSFFGVGKFDPKSRLWVRNTMFQGAPLVSDLGNEIIDDWSFPLAPGHIEESRR